MLPGFSQMLLEEHLQKPLTNMMITTTTTDTTDIDKIDQTWKYS